MTGADPATALLSGRIIIQFKRFALVGLANTVTALLVIWVLHEKQSLSVLSSSGAGYALATVQSYWLNRRWTFVRANKQPVVPQFVVFAFICIVCGALFSVLNVYFEKSFHFVFSTILAIGVTFPFNFLLNRLFVFNFSRESDV